MTDAVRDTAANIAGILDRPAALAPDRAAMIMDDGSVCTYGSLAGATGHWAATLHDSGVAHGDRVALADWGGVRSVAATLAAASIGAATAQMNPLLTSGELAQLVAAAGCTTVAVAGPGASAALAGALGRGAVVLDAPAGHEVDGESPSRHDNPEATAIVLFTSGTTGLPKPVPITHAAVRARLTAYRAPFDPDRTANVSIMCVPSFHVGGLLGLIMNLYSGDTTVVQPRFDAGRWLELVERHRVTSSFLVPTMLTRILEHPDFTKRDLSSLTSIAYGAAAAPVSLIGRAMEAMPTVAFSNVFGQTETLGAYTTLSAADHRDPRRIGSVGRPLPGVSIRVVGPDGGDVPTGEVGELWVSAPQNVTEGWLHTGDLARLDEDGYLYPAGRRSDNINRGGEKFSPAEVADALRSHPAVADVAVAGVPDEEMGERVGAALVVAEGCTPPSEEELRRWCAGRLAPFKLPEIVVFVEALPYNELGKLPRRATVALIEEARPR